MYIVIIRYTAPLEEVDRHRVAHKVFLAEGYARGHFIVSGRQDPPVGGVILAKGMPQAELEAFLQQDGYAKAGVAEYEILRFEPVSHDPLFTPLMSGK